MAGSDEDGAYLCGLLCAAGRVECGRKGNYYISLGSSKWGFVGVFSSAMERSVGKPRVYTGVRESGERTRISYRVVKYGKSSVEGFVSYWDLAADTGSWRVPVKCMQTPDLGLAFLRGFFDYEGVVTEYVKKTPKGRHKTRRVRCTSSSAVGLGEVRGLLEGVGIRSCLYRQGAYSVLDVEGKTRLETFRKKVGFSVPNKRRQLDRALSPAMPGVTLV